jgi:hypothetical protein
MQPPPIEPACPIPSPRHNETAFHASCQLVYFTVPETDTFHFSLLSAVQSPVGESREARSAPLRLQHQRLVRTISPPHIKLSWHLTQCTSAQSY